MKFNKIIKITVLFLLAILVVYFIVRLATIGQMQFIEIDKSDENLGIKKSDELLAAIEREKQFKDNQGKGNPIVETKEKPNEEKEKIERFQILLLGLDSRSKNDKRSRSDAIMLVTMDFNTKEIKLSSFVRDLQVDINGRKDKINHAYANGGGESTLRVLNQNFNLDVRNFAAVNMFDLREIVDIIGGLEIDITNAERKEINYRVKELADIEGRRDYELLSENGLQHLNGEQVVAYGRIRNTAGGDFVRTDRQREVISLIIEKVKGKNLVELVGIANKLFPFITTTLTTNEIENIILKTLSNGIDYEIKSARFPSDKLSYSDMSTGVYYLKIRDKEKFIDELHEFVY